MLNEDFTHYDWGGYCRGEIDKRKYKLCVLNDTTNNENQVFFESFENTIPD